MLLLLQRSQQRCSADSGEATGVRVYEEGAVEGERVRCPKLFSGTFVVFEKLGNPVGRQSPATRAVYCT